jgi:hypothetical protein
MANKIMVMNGTQAIVETSGLMQVIPLVIQDASYTSDGPTARLGGCAFTDTSQPPPLKGIWTWEIYDNTQTLIAFGKDASDCTWDAADVTQAPVHQISGAHLSLSLGADKFGGAGGTVKFTVAGKLTSCNIRLGLGATNTYVATLVGNGQATITIPFTIENVA